MSDLSSKQWVRCRGGVHPRTSDEIKPLLNQLQGWEVIDDHHLRKMYRFSNFRDSLTFVNKIGELAEDQCHHPDICFGWGQADIKIFFYNNNATTESDFILAAKIDEIR